MQNMKEETFTRFTGKHAHVRQRFEEKYGLTMSYQDCESIVAAINDDRAEWVHRDPRGCETWLAPFGDRIFPVVYNPETTNLVTVLRPEEFEENQDKTYASVKKSLRYHYDLPATNADIRTLGRLIREGQATACMDIPTTPGRTCWNIILGAGKSMYLVYNRDEDQVAAVLPPDCMKNRERRLRRLKENFRQAGVNVTSGDILAMEQQILGGAAKKIAPTSPKGLSQHRLDVQGKAVRASFRDSSRQIINIRVAGHAPLAQKRQREDDGMMQPMKRRHR